MEAQENGGKTPLLLAVSAGLVPTVRLLIESRACINAKNKIGKGIWQMVPEYNNDHAQAIKALLRRHKAEYTTVKAATSRRHERSSLAREMRYRALHPR